MQISIKKHHSLLLSLVFIVPFLGMIAYLSGFNQQAYAAVAFDSKSSTAINDKLQSPSWQHTTGSSPNRILIVSTDATGFSAVSGVTYKGVALTQIKSQGFAGVSSASLWYLLNPSPGPGTITMSSGLSYVVAGAATYYNIDQTNPFSSATVIADSRGTGPATANITVPNTNTNQLVVDALAMITEDATQSPVPGSGQTQTFLSYYIETSANGRYSMGGSHKLAVAGSTSMSSSINSATNSYWGDIAIALNSADPPPTPTTYTISGSIFHDTNNNGLKDSGETDYSGTPGISASRGTVTANNNGTYTISNLTAGTVTISYTSLPSGYNMTYPFNGPPPTFQVTVGPGCNTSGANGASCQ